MSVGYAGYAEIGGKLLLATSISAPLQRNRLESNAAYKGTVSVGSNQGIAFPHTYDLDSYDGSASFEVTKDAFDSLIKPWILSRQTSKEIKFQTRGNDFSGLQRLPECYWTSIGISASEASSITSSISFMSWKKYSNISGTSAYGPTDNYIGNKFGSISSNLNELSSGDIPALNPSGLNINPIPFWQSSVTGLVNNSNTKVTDWSLNISQELSKGFTCGYHSEPQEPDFLIFGVVTGTIDLTMMIINDSYTVQPELTSVVCTLCSGSSINLGVCQDDNFEDALAGPTSLVPFTTNYVIYGPIS